MYVCMYVDSVNRSLNLCMYVCMYVEAPDVPRTLRNEISQEAIEFRNLTLTHPPTEGKRIT